MIRNNITSLAQREEQRILTTKLLPGGKSSDGHYPLLFLELRLTCVAFLIRVAWSFLCADHSFLNLSNLTPATIIKPTAFKLGLFSLVLLSGVTPISSSMCRSTILL